MYMEIRPMNLTRVSYDPGRGQPREESLSEKMRKSAERKFMKQMQQYNLKKMQREDENFLINKKAENFIFSNYPSSKPKGDFSVAFDNRKFGPGSREKLLAEWKEKVGGNYQAFQSWYESSKQAEDQALYKSFYKNPAKYKSDKAYKNAISNWMNSMDADEQQEILNNAPAEVLQIINSNWKSADEGFFNRLGRNLGVGEADADDDSMVPELAATGVAIGSGLGYLGSKGRLAGKGLQQLAKIMPMPGARTTKNIESVFSKGKLSADEVLKKATDKLDDIKSTKANVIPHKNIRGFQKNLNELVKQGGLESADAKKFKGVIDKIIRSGKELNVENIGKAIKEGGDEMQSLRRGLDRLNVSSIGPIRMSSLKSSLGLAAGVGVISYGAARAMGYSDEQAKELAGATGFGASQLNPAGMRQVAGKVRDVIKKKGAGYVMKKIAAKGGIRLLGSVGAKALLGTATPVGSAIAAGLLATDLYAIYNILSDDIED